MDREYLEKLLFACQKVRSTVIETFLRSNERTEIDEVDECALEMLDCYLFSRKINIVTLLEKVLEKNVIEDIDYYNIAFLANKSLLLKTYCNVQDMTCIDPLRAFLKE